MGRNTPLTSTTRISEINLTPLMDVTFILLITFIMVFPTIEQGIAINLPKDSEPTEAEAPDNMKQVSIDLDGQFSLGDQRMDAERLLAELEQMALSDSATTIWIRADERIPYKKVVEVLKMVKKAGIVNMSLVTQAE